MTVSRFGMRKWAVAAVAAIFVIAQPAPAHAGEAIEFLDGRPVVIDLTHARIGQRWRVSVYDGQLGRGHDFFLTAAFRPDAVLQVTRPHLRLDEGKVGVFEVRLRSRLAGSGELILSSGGVIIRRPINVVSRRQPAAIPIGRLQFTGVRMTPFGEHVRVDNIFVPDAPDSGATGATSKIGLLTTRSGDTADVMRFGNTFAVVGATGPGEYEGQIDLLPGEPGGEAESVLRIRDFWAWPLLVLVLGLLVIEMLSNYQTRERPRRVLDLHLSWLREEAIGDQRNLYDTYRIVSPLQESPLLLDRLIVDARNRFDRMLTNAERAQWEIGGAEYVKIAAVVQDFKNLAVSVTALHDERIATFAGRRAERSLDNSPVGLALSGRPLHSHADVTSAVSEVGAARVYLRDFRRIYRRATDIAADDILAHLHTGPKNLTPLDDDLQQRIQQSDSGEITKELPSLRPMGRRSKFAQHVQIGDAIADRGRHWPRLAVIAAVSIIAILLIGSLSTLHSPSESRLGQGSAQSTSSPQQRPSSPPELPVAADSPPPQLGAAPKSSAQPSLVLDAVLPLALLGIVILGAMWILRRRQSQPIRLDSVLQDRRMRRTDRNFALVGGLLVVCSGMSVLYFANSSFGGLGDYLSMAIWSTAFGEGLTLARRLWPIAG